VITAIPESGIIAHHTRAWLATCKEIAIRRAILEYPCATGA